MGSSTSITEATILHHVCIVLLLLWFLNSFNYCHPLAYFLSLIYLYLVHEGYVLRLTKKVQFEEKRDSTKKRVLTDSETVRWLNHALEKMWLVCMEDIVSQKILLPIIPWFLQKYKPWTVQEVEVQKLYLGRSPPIFTEMRVLQQTNGDDHLVMELGMNFRTADDMSAVLAAKLTKRLGFGMSAKMHLLGMHVEGKVLVGVKFLRRWPFIGRLRVCFSRPPYFQMTVKPLFTHGVDVTEVPGIAGWIDNLLALVFEQTLVEPNMLVVDVEKFVSAEPEENWFTVDAKDPVAHAVVEIIEATEMKPSDLNGLADPYVKGQLGPFKFKTRIQKKTLTPVWREEFKVPICTWEAENVLAIEVRDKDHIFDDMMGDCTVNINELRDGERHDIWLPLQNIKMGRLHLAVTVIEGNGKDAEPSSGSNVSDSDKFEPIDVEGQSETGIWIHQPGEEVPQVWEQRKGKSRYLDTRHLDSEIKGEIVDPLGTIESIPPISVPNYTNSIDECEDADKPQKDSSFKRGLSRIGSVFSRSPKPDLQSDLVHEPEPSPRSRAVDVKEVGVKSMEDDNIIPPSPKVGVKFMVDDNIIPSSPKDLKEDDKVFSDEGGLQSPRQGNVKDMAKGILKQAGKSARSLKASLSRKASRKYPVEDELSPTSKEVVLEQNNPDHGRLKSPDTAASFGNISTGDNTVVTLRELALSEDRKVETPKRNSFQNSEDAGISSPKPPRWSDKEHPNVKREAFP